MRTKHCCSWLRFKIAETRELSSSCLLSLFVFMFILKVSILTHGGQCFVSTSSQMRHHFFCFVSLFFFKNLSKVSVLSPGQQCFVNIPSLSAKLVFALSAFRCFGSKASMPTKHCSPWVKTDTFEARKRKKPEGEQTKLMTH